MAERSKRIRDGSDEQTLAAVEGQGQVDVGYGSSPASVRPHKQQEAATMTAMVAKAAETNSKVVDSLIAANREKNNLLSRTADMAVDSQQHAYNMALSVIQSKRLEEQAAQKSFRDKAQRQQLEAELKAQKVVALRGKDLAIRQLEQKIKVQEISTNATEATNRQLHQETLSQLEQIQKQRAHHHSGAEERSLRQEVDCLQLERDALKIRLNQVGEMALGHRSEVSGLLQLVEELGHKAENHAVLKTENGRLQALVRRLEAKMSPQQVIEAALPDDFIAPSSFQALGDEAPPTALRGAAPDFWAWRTLDFKEQSIGTMVGQWVDALSEASELKDQLESEKANMRKSHERNVMLIQTLAEEKHHRTSLQATLDKLHRDGLVRSEQHWGAAHHGSSGDGDSRSQVLEHSISELQGQYSSILNAKTLLVVQLESTRAHLHEKTKDVEALKLKLQAATEESKSSNIAQTLAQLRLHYEQDMRRFSLQHQQVQGQLVKTRQETNNRVKEVKELRASLALANEAITATANEKQRLLEKLRVFQEGQSDTRNIALKNLTSALQARRAELRSLIQEKGVNAVPAPTSGGVASLHGVQMAEFEQKINQMSGQIHETLKAVAESPLLSGADRAHTEVAVMRSQLSEMLSSFIHLVVTETKTTEDVRGGFIRQRVADQHLIDSLRVGLEDSKKESASLKESVKGMTAMLEVNSVDTTETVLMHSVAIGSIDCEKCSVMKEETRAWEAKFVEGQKELEAMHQLNRRGVETATDLRHALSTSELQANQGQLVQSRLNEQAALDQQQVSTLRRAVIQSEQSLAAYNAIADEEDEEAVPAATAAGGSSRSSSCSQTGSADEGGEDATTQQQGSAVVLSKKGSAAKNNRDQLAEAFAVLTASIDQLVAQRAGVLGGENTGASGGGGEGGDHASVDVHVGDETPQGPMLPEKVSGIVECLQALWGKVQEVETIQKKKTVAVASSPTSATAASSSTASTKAALSATTTTTTGPAAGFVPTEIHRQQSQQLKDAQAKLGQLTHDKTQLENQLQTQKGEIDTLNSTVLFVNKKVTQKEEQVLQEKADRTREQGELQKVKGMNVQIMDMIKEINKNLKAEKAKVADLEGRLAATSGPQAE